MGSSQNWRGKPLINYQVIINFIKNTRVINIDRKKKQIQLKNQENPVNYDKLILATGSKPKILPALSGNFKNVFSLKSIADLLAIKEYLEKENVRDILILGAGYIGLETAEALKKLRTT